MQVDLDIRIHGFDPIFGRVQLFAADVVCAVQDLTLEIGEIHDVIIDQTQCARYRLQQDKARSENRGPRSQCKGCWLLLIRFCPSRVTSGMMRWREYRAISSLLKSMLFSRSSEMMLFAILKGQQTN